MESNMCDSIPMHVRHLVIPGQVIATSSEGNDGSGGFLRGHGTYIEGSVNSPDETDDDPSSSDQRLIASVAGTVERVNKLISVTPFSPTPYDGHVGDLVIGRIASVGASRWKVHLGHGCREAHLPLSGVNLPGGVQRIRTSEDALGMRSLFAAGDLVSAEVQKVGHADGVFSLHTRSMKYGKLENGCLVTVPPALVQRMKHHFASLPEYVGVDVLMGTNGFVWVQRTPPKEWREQLSQSQEEVEAPLAETLQKLRWRHVTTPVLPDERENICRVRNSIEALKLVYSLVTPETIMKVYDASVENGVGVKDMLLPERIVFITNSIRK